MMLTFAAHIEDGRVIETRLIGADAFPATCEITEELIGHPRPEFLEVTGDEVVFKSQSGHARYRRVGQANARWQCELVSVATAPDCTRPREHDGLCGEPLGDAENDRGILSGRCGGARPMGVIRA